MIGGKKVKRKHLTFYYADGVQMNGEGLYPEDRQKMEEFLHDLLYEIGEKLGYFLGDDFSVYIGPYSNFDVTLLIDASDDEVYDKVSTYLHDHYMIEFKQKLKEAK